MTRWQRFSAWIVVNWRPVGMFLSLGALYAIRKWAPLAQDELDLLEGIWVVLGFGAVFTPNFRSPPK